MSDPIIPATENEHARWTLLGLLLLLGILGGSVTASVALGPKRPHWPAAVAVAAGVTGISAISGWLAGRRRPANPAATVATALAGTCLRTFLPLAVLGWLTVRGGTLAEAGCRELIVALYLALLATTILLNIVDRPAAR